MSNSFDKPIDLDVGPLAGCVSRTPGVFFEDLEKIPLQIMEPTTVLDLTLAQRGSRYGDFTNNARVAQQMREIVRAAESWSKMTPVEREALDDIILKISRIVTGDPHYPDNWHDIQGFAKLVEDRITPGPSPAIP